MSGLLWVYPVDPVSSFMSGGDISIIHLAVIGRRPFSDLKSRIRVVETLINAGAKLEERGTIYKSPSFRDGEYESTSGPSVIEVAAREFSPDCIELVKLLLKQGVNPNPPPDYGGANALFIACQEGKLELVKLLLEAKMNPNSRNENYGPPLSAAAERGDWQMAQLLPQAEQKLMSVRTTTACCSIRWSAPHLTGVLMWSIYCSPLLRVRKLLRGRPQSHKSVVILASSQSS